MTSLIPVKVKRMLKLKLSDGVQDIVAMEYKRIIALSRDVQRGTKVVAGVVTS